MFTFVTGGVRSGKSGYPLRRASEQGPPLTDRGFLDAAGMANQMLAEQAGSVVLMVSGVPLRLR